MLIKIQLHIVVNLMWKAVFMYKLKYVVHIYTNILNSWQTTFFLRYFFSFLHTMRGVVVFFLFKFFSSILHSWVLFVFHSHSF